MGVMSRRRIKDKKKPGKPIVKKEEKPDSKKKYKKK